MKINIVVDVADRGAHKGSSVREKIKHGFILLFTPLRADVLFSDEIHEDSINLFYGSERPPVKKELLFLKASEEFADCIKEARLPVVSTTEWFESYGKKLPRLFPVNNGVLEFDIAAASFMLASEFQDLISLDRDEFDRLRAMDSLQDKLGVLDFPVVNYYSFLLKAAVERFSGIQIELKKYDGADHGLALTHDVDYTSSLNIRMLRRNFFGHFILNKEKLAPNERGVKMLYPLLAITGYDPPKNGLKFLRAAEIRHQVRSTFFIKSGGTAKQDVKYSLSSGVLKSFLAALNEGGFEIGMHPSMKTYLDESLFVLEKRKLEEKIGFEVHAVRQHYLKFTAGKTVGIWEKAGIKYDSTLGFSRKAGFRGSIAFPFPLYNFERDSTSNVIEVPLVLMDGTFADNRSLSENETYKKMKRLIDEAKAAHGAASILFHNSLTDSIDFRGYKNIYDMLLTDSARDGFRMDTLSRLIENFQ